MFPSDPISETKTVGIIYLMSIIIVTYYISPNLSTVYRTERMNSTSKEFGDIYQFFRMPKCSNYYLVGMKMTKMKALFNLGARNIAN